jgi:lipoprotein-anchoring transpeptidase ErfK/SrfK
MAVPRRGKEWSGVTAIGAKYVNPDWSPPAAVKADHPELPNLIPGGSPRNPMGVRAMLLDRGEIAIHGTTSKMRASIGSAASYGCIRMLNEDVADLYDRVSVGSPVVMQP